jgi:hypothetical protein
MKCISVIQPWATLIVLGVKRLETRTWRTPHRGRLAIHATRNFPEAARARCLAEPFHSLLRDAGYLHSADLPRGAIVGAVELLDCVPGEEALRLVTDSPEPDFGDYGSGRWAWRLVNPCRLAAPVPFCGRLGLFEVPDFFQEAADSADAIAGRTGPHPLRSA